LALVPTLHLALCTTEIRSSSVVVAEEPFWLPELSSLCRSFRVYKATLGSTIEAGKDAQQFELFWIIRRFTVEEF
jgi:hypothetical protein